MFDEVGGREVKFPSDGKGWSWEGNTWTLEWMCR